MGDFVQHSGRSRPTPAPGQVDRGPAVAPVPELLRLQRFVGNSALTRVLSSRTLQREGEAQANATADPAMFQFSYEGKTYLLSADDLAAVKKHLQDRLTSEALTPLRNFADRNAGYARDLQNQRSGLARVSPFPWRRWAALTSLLSNEAWKHRGQP